MLIHSEEIQPLYSVEFALNVVDRGLLVLFAVPDPMLIDVQIGDPLEFVRPDGAVFPSRVKAIHLTVGSNPGLLGLLLPDGAEKEDIPFGSKLRFVKAT